LEEPGEELFDIGLGPIGIQTVAPGKILKNHGSGSVAEQLLPKFAAGGVQAEVIAGLEIDDDRFAVDGLADDLRSIDAVFGFQSLPSLSESLKAYTEKVFIVKAGIDRRVNFVAMALESQ
jgi:hypothetical protein